MLAIVVSQADSASVHIGEHLRELADWTVETDADRPASNGGGEVYRTDDAELRIFEKRHLDMEGVAAAFDDPDLLVFASKHAGETGKLLTAHHTGNFGPAEYGGTDGGLARSCPNAHKRVVEALATHAPEDYEVGMECTHHGPSEVGVPSMFVEVGSAEQQWADPAAARAVARAILDLRGVAADAPRENGSRRHLAGFGGGHYVPRFERVVRETDWAVGHIAADWCLDAMGDPTESHDVLRRALDRSAADHALVTGDHPDLVDALETVGATVVGERFLRETTGVPLGLVSAVEDRLGAVEDGVRYGAVEDADPDDLVVVDLPAELCETAQGIDAEAARAAVADRAVAYETSEGASRLGERAVLDTARHRQAIVEALADVLAERYDSVTVEAGAVVASERAFDPEKARTLGISEGPAFGKLSAGQSVEVNGRTIDPDVVHVERTHRYEY